MNTDAAGATSAEILRLVQHALDEIDRVEIDATLRRTVRIASLLGDSHSASAWRLNSNRLAVTPQRTLR